MDGSSFLHRSDSRYCFSLDEKRALIRLAVSKKENVDKIYVVYGDPITFKNQHKEQHMVIKHEDDAFFYFETIINAFPMRLMYIFQIIYKDKTYYWGESGLFDHYYYDLAFISAFQFVGENKNDFIKEKEAWKGRVIYQIFPDRFASRVDPKTKPYVNMDWNNINIRNRRDAFLGGDLYGIIDKLDYLKDLGVGAIYLTPIHPSNSNHKYNVRDYFGVDETFGGKKAFEELVNKAHERDIKIMMDLVFNHMAYDHPIFQDVVEKGKDSLYYDWFFIDGDFPKIHPLNYRCFGYYAYMPKLNTNNKKVQNYLISVGQYWIMNYEIDGYRLDVSEGVSHDFWNKFKIACREMKDDILIIGENWHNSESYLGNNQLDSVMNYPFLGCVSSYVLKQIGALKMHYSLENLLMRHKDGHNRMMMNILASHDIQRIMNLVNQNKDLSLISYAIMMFYIGYPLIYYGEEIFMEGGDDPDNRRGMIWDKEAFENEKAQIFKKLVHLRKEKPLIEGEIEIGNFNRLFFIRRYIDKVQYILYTNNTDEAIPFKGNVILKNNYQNELIEPNGFVVIKSYY